MASGCHPHGPAREFTGETNNIPNSKTIAVKTKRRQNLLAAAHRRALAKVSRDIAAAIRAEAKP